MTLAPDTRARLEADALKAIDMLGLDADRAHALAQLVVTNQETTIGSIHENAKQYGKLLGFEDACSEIMLERADEEEPFIVEIRTANAHLLDAAARATVDRMTS